MMRIRCSPPPLPLFLLFLLPFTTSFSFPPSQPDRFIHTHPLSPIYSRSSPQQQLEVAQPLPSDHLKPACSVSLLNHSFSDTAGQPPVAVDYSPPSDCPPPSNWTHLVLQMNATCRGEQYDRIAAVWLAGAEILRTSTSEPTEDGVLWSVRKDVTKYSTLFAMSNISLSMMLENVVNDVYTGVYDVNLTLVVYDEETGGAPQLGSWIRKLGFGSDILGGSHGGTSNWDEKPADLIVPVSDDAGLGFWYRIGNESFMGSRNVDIPSNSRRIMLEMYVSAHGDDEFWYSNPPNIYIESNNLTTKRGNGAFREAFVRIDGHLVASEIPFPVIYTGGINPLLWKPVVAIGAFNLPSYNFDLTPFLGLILDGRTHTFEIGVANAIDFWLVDANLHVWIDKGSDSVEAGLSLHHPPKFGESWEWELDGLDGSFKVEAERKSHTVGWLSSSCGNFTTHQETKRKFENKIKFHGNGTYKVVKQKVKSKTEVTVRSSDGEDRVVSKKTMKRKYPLHVITETKPGPDNNTLMMTTKVSHELKEKSSTGKMTRTVSNGQRSNGWMKVKDHSVLSGSANTQQRYRERSHEGCYERQVDAANGELVSDVSSSLCSGPVGYFYGVLEELSLGVW